MWFIISLLIIIFDQIFKFLVVSNISLTDSIEVIPKVMHFVYVKNTGAAFSILEGKTYLLSIVSVLVCAALVIYMIKTKPESKMLSLSISLILGGAVGNLIDRLTKGFVVDFIEPMFIRFPVFNFADIAITVGAVLLVVYVMFFDGKSE